MAAKPRIRLAHERTDCQDTVRFSHVVKFDNIYHFSDAEMDFAFALAKAAGARGISCELEVDGSKRVGQFADTHNMVVGYHGHTKTPESMFKEAFSYATHNWANLDIGHYIAGNLGDPVDFIRRYHDRITHIHVKDRKAGANGQDHDSMMWRRQNEIAVAIWDFSRTCSRMPCDGANR